MADAAAHDPAGAGLYRCRPGARAAGRSVAAGEPDGTSAQPAGWPATSHGAGAPADDFVAGRNPAAASGPAGLLVPPAPVGVTGHGNRHLGMRLPAPDPTDAVQRLVI